MNLIKYLRARRHGGVTCRDQRGFREVLVPMPRPHGGGIDLLASDGKGYVLKPLEVGRLREGMRQALLASEHTDADPQDQDAGPVTR